MNKSKSVQLLSAFSKDELSRSDDFLKSPYFNKNNRVIRLYKELAKDHPEFNSRNIQKEKLYKELFPGKEYNDQIMKNLNSEFLRLRKGIFII